MAAKHGQSPIDPQSKRRGHRWPVSRPLSIGGAEAFDISDDGSLIWLTDPVVDSGRRGPTLSKAAEPASYWGVEEIFARQLPARTNSTVPTQDPPRTPDIILKVDTGVIFTGGSKIAEHGGFNEDDVHTALLLSMDGMQSAVVKSATTNQQVAPTIIQALGLNPSGLDAVREEQITVLPFLFERRAIKYRQISIDGPAYGRALRSLGAPCSSRPRSRPRTFTSVAEDQGRENDARTLPSDQFQSIIRILESDHSSIPE